MSRCHLFRWLHLCLIAPSLVAVEYSIVDLGLGTATGIDASGTVIGSTPREAFIYRNGDRQVTHINASFLGANPPTAYGLTGLQWHGIGDAGFLVGSAYLTNHGSSIPPFPTNHRYPILWAGTGDGIILSVTNGQARAVNSSGVAVGSGSLGGTPESFRLAGVDLESLVSDGLITAAAINDFGVIAGSSQSRAATWSNGVVHVPDIDATFGESRFSEATAINSTGQIAGTLNYVSRMSSRILDRGFLWSNEVTTWIGPGEDLQTRVRAIDNSGVAVGSMERFPANPRAFIFRDGQLMDLNSLIPNSGWELGEANDINAAGQIVGRGHLNGERALRAFLLNPLTPGQPLPPSILQEPVGGEYIKGSIATLSVISSGTAPLIVQWQYDGANLEGETNATLTLSNLDPTDSGNYRAVIRNVAGLAYSKWAPVIVRDPAISIARYAGLTISGEVGARYQIDSAPHISPTDWTEITRIILTNTTQLWLDLSSGTHPRVRFYRVTRVEP